MNNIFNIRRFSNYFMYDLRNAKNNYGLSMVVVGLIPVIMFAFSQTMIWIVGAENVDVVYGVSFRIMSMILATTIVMLTSPVKMYGRITERRYGSDWLLVPASTFEKWLSMVLVTVLVVPVVMVAFLLVSDTFLSLVFPARYGENIFSALDGINIFAFEVVPSELSINLVYPFIISWVSSSLVFTLGAVCFKRAKVAKTILICMVIGVFFSLFFSASINEDSLNLVLENICDYDGPEQIVRMVNNWLNILSFAQIVVVMAGLFFRLKTIKH